MVRDHLSRLSAAAWNPTIRADRAANSLVKAISEYFRLAPAEVVPVAGSAAGIEAVLRYFSPIPIVHVVPDFPGAARLAELDRRAYRPVPLAWSDDLAAALEPLASTGSLLVLSSPSNPLGRVVEPNQLERLLGVWQGPVLIDEAYADYSEGSALELVERYDRLIVSRTFSKAWGLADLRVAFLAGQAVATAEARRFMENIVPNAAAAHLASALLRDPQPVLRSIDETIRMRTRMLETFRSLAGMSPYPSQANYLAVECDDAPALTVHLAAAGFRVKDLATLRNWPLHWHRGFRISVCPQPLFEELLIALRDWAFDQKRRSPSAPISRGSSTS